MMAQVCGIEQPIDTPTSIPLRRQALTSWLGGGATDGQLQTAPPGVPDRPKRIRLRTPVQGPRISRCRWRCDCGWQAVRYG